MRLVVGDTRALARLRLLVSPPLLLPEDTPRAVRMGAIPAPPACHPSMPACGDTPWRCQHSRSCRRGPDRPTSFPVPVLRARTSTTNRLLHLLLSFSSQDTL